MVKSNLVSKRSEENQKVKDLNTKIKELISNDTFFNIEDLLELIFQLNELKPAYKVLENSYIILILSLLIKSYSTSNLPILESISLKSKSLLLQITEFHCTNKNLSKDSLIFNQVQAVLNQLEPVFLAELNPQSRNEKIAQCACILNFMDSLSFGLVFQAFRKLASEKNVKSFFSLFTSEKYPYLPMEMANNYTLVLDMDETLGHYQGERFFVRPGAREFLAEMGKYYELVLFTSAQENYANSAMNLIDPQCLVKLRLYRQHVRVFENKPVKDLRCIGRNISKTIIVDNDSSNFRLQPANGIEIKTWKGDSNDTELFSLMAILKNIAQNKPSSIIDQMKSIINNKINNCIIS